MQSIRPNDAFRKSSTNNPVWTSVKIRLRFVFDNRRRMVTTTSQAVPHASSLSQVQSREADNLLRDVDGHAPAVEKLEDAARDMVELPSEAVDKDEKKGISELSGKKIVARVFVASGIHEKSILFI